MTNCTQIPEVEEVQVRIWSPNVFYLICDIEPVEELLFEFIFLDLSMSLFVVIFKPIIKFFFLGLLSAG
jgi:hypothetical protein